MTTLLLQLSDLHLFAEPEAVLRGVPTRDSLAEVLEAVRGTGLDFGRVVVTGDFTHDERRETYQAAHGLLDEWIDRCHVLPGNHDDRVLLREVFGDRAGGTDQGICFSESVGGWRLIGVDTHIPGEVPGRVEPAMLDWLAGELDQHSSQPTILFQHHPPISVGSAWLDAIGLRDPGPFRELVIRSPQVRVVSCGHVHQESVGMLGQAAGLTVPSTGVQFTPLQDAPRVDTIPTGFRVFAFDEPAQGEDAGSVSWSSRVIRLPAVTFPALDE